MSRQDWNAHAAEHLERYVGWLKEFCGIAGVSATGEGLGEAVAFLEERFAELGADCEKLKLDGAHPALVATFSPEGRAAGPSSQGGDGAGTLLFYDHYDVQPPDPIEEWITPPFQPSVRDGRIFARGASDNKGDIISRLAAVDLVRRYGRQAGPVKFLIEGEEEIGSPNLARYVRQYKSLLSADACIWESGSRDPGERFHLFLGLKGIAYVELSVRVADADLHSSYGAIVEGAANRLARAVASLRDGSGKVRIPGFYDQVVPPGPDVRAAVEHIPFESEKYRETFGVKRFLRGREGAGALAALLLEPSCTVCGIEGGYTGQGAKTVLPKEARAKIDFRLVPNQSPEFVVERLRHHLDMEGYEDVEVRVLAAEEPYRTDLNHPFVKQVSQAVRRVSGKEICLYPTHFGSGPMYPVGTELGVPIVSLGVSYWDSRNHAPNENIRLDDFRETIAVLAALIAGEE